MIPPQRLRRLQTVIEQRLDIVHVALEALYHRHNVSAILRTCDALGIHHVHLVEGTFKASKGAARGAERWLDLSYHPDPATAIRAIRQAGCTLWVADLDDDSVAPEDVPIAANGPICLWFGAELYGVSDEARQAADGVITIPMRGFAQSLNVSVAAALALRPIAERARQLGQPALLPEGVRQATLQEWLAREEAARTGAQRRSSAGAGAGPMGPGAAGSGATGSGATDSGEAAPTPGAASTGSASGAGA